MDNEIFKWKYNINEFKNDSRTTVAHMPELDNKLVVVEVFQTVILSHFNRFLKNNDKGEPLDQNAV